MSENIDKLIEELDKPVVPLRRKPDAIAQAELTYAAQADSSEGLRAPHYVILEEKPEHTLLAWMKAAGRSDEECAAELGYGRHHIRALMRQEWFKRRLDSVLKETNGDEVKAFISGQVMPSLTTLAEIRDDEGQKGPTRVAAANSLLDRALGKATVRVETKQLAPDTSDATNEVEQLRAEAATLSRQLAANGVSLSPN